MDKITTRIGVGRVIVVPTSELNMTSRDEIFFRIIAGAVISKI